MFYTYCCYAFYVVFVPMQGRECNTNPEILMGFFTALMVLLFAPFLVPLFCLFRKSKTIISIFGICTIVFIIFAATPIAFPYAEKTAAQRFFAVVGPKFGVLTYMPSLIFPFTAHSPNLP